MLDHKRDRQNDPPHFHQSNTQVESREEEHRRGRQEEREREREGRRSLSTRFYLRLKRGEKERGWVSREEYLCMMMIMTEKSLSKEQGEREREMKGPVN